MKKIVQRYSPVALVALLLWSPVANAQMKYEFSHERSISQTYPAGANDQLKIENQFGNIVVKSWNKNEVKVDIRIEVSANDKNVAQKIFENIDVAHVRQGNTISFETDFHIKKKGDIATGNYKSDMRVNYEVLMPAGLTLSVENKFGNTILPDLTGTVNVEQQFGELVAGNLSKAGKINVKFGKAAIESAANGDYDFEFSEEVTINKLSGRPNIDLRYCKKSVINAAAIESLNLDAHYSRVAVVIPKNIPAGFDIDTHFGKFYNQSSFTIKEESENDDDDKGKKRIKPSFKRSYKGSAGSGNVRINLDAHFSDITIAHDAQSAKAKNKKETSI